MKSDLHTRFDTAFSLDQAEKVYVQDRILQYLSSLIIHPFTSEYSL